jgi:sugar phosphate isomerase/epimerase
VKIGLFIALYADLPLEEALDTAVAAGCGAVEIPSRAESLHCRPAELLADASARTRFTEAIAERGLEISALSCHGNPVHPRDEVASVDDRDYRDTVRLAAELGIGTVVTFSGCPGESEHSLHPSWITCSWPFEFPQVLEWQWQERVVPYWAEAGAFAREHGVRVAIEPHPGFVVYNTASMLRLRAAAGEAVGVNFDPSHLFWQGMDPLACVPPLAGAIFHVHAKDTAFNEGNLAVNGVLEPLPSSRPAERSWSFRSVGEGHPVAFWRDLALALQRAGYDGPLSIEHEDPLLSREDGLAVAVATLREALGE